MKKILENTRAAALAMAVITAALALAAAAACTDDEPQTAQPPAAAGLHLRADSAWAGTDDYGF